MRKYLACVLLLAVLLTAGCVEDTSAEQNSAVNHTTAATPVQAATPAATAAPTTIPTPLPEQLAFISNIQCSVGDKSIAVYHCFGNVRIPGGSYDTVQVIARYADNNTFRSGSVSLGGDDATSKPFYYFPDIRYQGQTPVYFLRMDSHVYPVSWNGGIGSALSNTPGAEGIPLQ